MLVQCWVSFADAGPALYQHRVNVPCLPFLWCPLTACRKHTHQPTNTKHLYNVLCLLEQPHRTEALSGSCSTRIPRPCPARLNWCLTWHTLSSPDQCGPRAHISTHVLPASRKRADPDFIDAIWTPFFTGNGLKSDDKENYIAYVAMGIQ